MTPRPPLIATQPALMLARPGLILAHATVVAEPAVPVSQSAVLSLDARPCRLFRRPSPGPSCSHRLDLLAQECPRLTP